MPNLPEEKKGESNNTLLRVTQILGVTSALWIFVEGFKQALPHLLLYLYPPVPLVSLPIPIKRELLQTSVFPSLVAHMPLLKRLPAWAFPIGDVVLVSTGFAARLHGFKFPDLIIDGFWDALTWCVTSVLYGTQGTETLYPSVSPSWFQSKWLLPLSFPLRFLTQHFVQVTMGVGVRKMVGGLVYPWWCGLKALFGIKTKIIAPPNVDDIIIEKAASRMASFDQCMELFMKFGIPFIGVLITLRVFYGLWVLQFQLNNEIDFKALS